MKIDLYFVGTPEGAKKRQYEAVSNSLEEADRLAQELGMHTYKREVDITPRKRRRKKK